MVARFVNTFTDVVKIYRCIFVRVYYELIFHHPIAQHGGPVLEFVRREIYSYEA